MQKSVFKKNLEVLFFSLFLFSSFSVFSQEAILWEPEFEVDISTETLWSYSFGLANRGILVETIDGEKQSNYSIEHIELNHFTSYGAWENAALSLGLRYRFREAFNDRREDELRFIQQISSKHSNEFLGWSHRGRFEQRLRSSETIFRFRYEFGLSKQLNRHFSLKLATEALYSISPQSKPAPEQRFELGVNNSTFGDWDFYLGAELRSDNYIRNPENELYILTAATLNL